MTHYKHLKKPSRRPGIRGLCLLLAALTLCVGLPVWQLGAKAASTPTNLGLAQHGINAYNEGWQYSYGGKGETVNGVRVSDCAGLIYAYFSDLGVGGCMGGATAQATQNCIFSGNLEDGIPRIHGLALTIFETGDPADGYSHIGIYIGNNESCENSDYGTNMVRGSIYNRSWNSWHLFDNGVLYPREGWYEFDGKMVHYSNYEYDVNTVVDGYMIGPDGFAQLDDGTPAPVDPFLLSDSYVSAEEVRTWLSTNGWSGTDDPNQTNFDYNATVSHSSVNLRSQPTTQSSVVSLLSKGARLKLGAAIQGSAVSIDGRTSDIWYPATTSRGQEGYISALLVELSVTAPIITSDGESVAMMAGDGFDIYYTTDGTEPTQDSTPYVSPVYQLRCTYKAIAVRDGVAGPVSTATVMGNGAVFNDFAYDQWYAEAVDQAVCLGLFGGTGGGKFSPKTKLSRAQFVKVLANLSGEDVSGYEFADKLSAFEDVPANAYYYHQLAWAVSIGVVSPSKTFNPNGEISREQVCAMLDRYLAYTGIDTTDIGSNFGEPFSDDQEISSWAKDAVYRMRSLGVVNGVGENRFNPKGSSDRSVACTMMVNFHKYVLSLDSSAGDNLPAEK